MTLSHPSYASLKLAFLIMFLSAVISGCASYPQSRALMSEISSDIPRQHQLDVPFVAQEDYFCGPAALSMMLQAQGLNLELSTLVNMVYVPERQGSFQIELKAAARRFELIPYELAPTMKSVFHEVSRGNPVLVLQNLALESHPVWHYALVVGYDLDDKTVTLHGGLEANTTIALGTFERQWANNAPSWAIVILPPHKVPATASPLPYQKTLEELIEVGQTSTAVDAYYHATEVWPGQSTFNFGLANLLYQLNEFEEAQTMFLEAILKTPNIASYWNNLAYALAELSCDNATQAVQCALALAPKEQNFKSSSKDIEAMLNANSEPTVQCAVLPNCPIQ
ncbi:hypothetical protein A3715_09930 [Oleiphilus sp. HI0009]|nr:hypothetical protein A3715_09930 [Oleiphilus sp. HI0009]